MSYIDCLQITLSVKYMTVITRWLKKLLKRFPLSPSQGTLLSFLLLLPLTSYPQEVIKTESTTTSTVTTNGDMTTRVESPPPTAIAPQIIANSNSDLCTVGVAGAVQTQILGISMGSTVRDMNCEKLKNAKVLYDMGMKVAAVSVMCQDERVFKAMMNAGTPCPYDGLIGDAAKLAWETDQASQPESEGILDSEEGNAREVAGASGVLGVFAVLLLL